MSKKRGPRKSYPTENVTARMFAPRADLVRRAAIAADQNVSDYVGERIAPIAARELGEVLPPIPDMKLYSEAVDEAAKKIGRSRHQLEKMMRETIVSTILASAAPPPGKRGGRQMVDLGHFEQPPAVIRRRSRAAGSK